MAFLYYSIFILSFNERLKGFNMMFKKLPILFYVIPLLSYTAVSQNVERTKVNQEADGTTTLQLIDTDSRAVEIKQSDENAFSVYEFVQTNAASLPADLVSQTAKFIKLLLDKRKIDTDLLYNYILTLNANINSLNDPVFVGKVRELTSDLRASSYNDKIHYNTNLSYQIRTRMPLLVKASLLLNEKGASKAVIDYRKVDFYEELDFFTDKYLKSSRFQAGLGFSYSYTPQISYKTNTDVDLSPFSPQTGSETTNIMFEQEFSNKSYLNFEIAAKLPYLELGLSVPSYSETSKIVAPVKEELLFGTENQFAIYQSSIESTLKVEYDFSIRVPLLGNYKKIKSSRALNKQMDWGIILGVTGFNVQDRIISDVRFRNDATAFNDLPQGQSLETKRDTSFQALYYGAYYEFEFVDELYMTVDVRWHESPNNDGSQINVDGFTSSLRLIYSPTLDFIDWSIFK
jgi:hypothetical protein